MKLQADFQVLRFQAKNWLDAVRRSMKQHAANAIIAVAAFSALLFASRTAAWHRLQRLPAVAQDWLGHAGVDALFVVMISLPLLWAYQEAKVLAQLHQHDWLAAVPIKPTARKRFRQLSIAFRCGCILLALSLTAKCFGVSLALLAALSLGFKVALGGILSLNFTSSVAIASNMRSAPTMRGAGHSAQNVSATIQAWWQSFRPSSQRRAKLWFLPILLLPGGMSFSGLLGLAIVLLASLELYLQSGTAHRLAYDMTRLYTPLSSSYSQLRRQFFRASYHALAFPALLLAIAIVFSPMPITLKCVALALMLLLILQALFFALATRHQPQQLPALQLKFAATLLLAVAIFPASGLVVLIVQIGLLAKRAEKAADLANTFQAAFA